jgi:hypothetical protein
MLRKCTELLTSNLAVQVTINDESHPYQLETAINGGVQYFDLSAADGDPFAGYNRLAAVSGTGCAVECGAGQTGSSCEYPDLVMCNSQNDLVLTICA